jgi:hypothetical protein
MFDGTGIASDAAREHVEPVVHALQVELGDAGDGRRVRAVRARTDVEVEPDRDAEQRRRDDPGEPVAEPIPPPVGQREVRPPRQVGTPD